MMTLTIPETAKLTRHSSAIVASLDRLNFTCGRGLSQLIQIDPDDAYERRSAICPYEQLRARKIIKAALSLPAKAGRLGPWFGTVGDPKLRLRPRHIAQFSPATVLRRWRSAIMKLRKLNPSVVGVCVVELQLCRTLNRPDNGGPRYFFEPHMHFVLYGVTEEQVRKAFHVRTDPTNTVRKRPVKVQPVYDLDGLLGYFTKSRPEFRRQYLDKKSGKLRWGKSRFPERHLAKWYMAISQYKVSELLTATGISLKILGLAGAAELATSPNGMVPGRPRGPNPRH